MLKHAQACGRTGLAAALLLAAVTTACNDVGPTLPIPGAASKVNHVFIIVLENKNFEETFGTSTQDPYLRNTLVPQGALLTQYWGTSHVSLGNYISMISGQAPTPDTDNDCVPGFLGEGRFDDVQQTGTAEFNQVIAQHGCVYPAHVKTLADQMDQRGLTWKGYMGDMGNDPTRESATCGHPPVNGVDVTNIAQAPTAEVPQGDAYATRHNPFVYFHSIIDSPKCQRNVVNLEKLNDDLKSISKTPNLVFITPNLCDDGHDGDGTGRPGTTCADGRPGGLTSADDFLEAWVPKILASPAYKKDGLLLITFDESGYASGGATVDGNGVVTYSIISNGESCCNQQPGPNLAGERPGSFTIQASPTLIYKIIINGYGGDRVGALLLSPFIKPGSTSDIPYNHYSLLKSLEQVFGIKEYLGYAAQPGLESIAENPDIFKIY